MRILFLHGWQSTPGGRKPTYLKDHGHTVLNPALPEDDFDAAVRFLERYRVLSPMDPNAFVALGETYGTMRRYDEAEDLYRRTLAAQAALLGPAHDESVRTALNLASVLHDTGRFDEVVELHRDMASEKGVAVRTELDGYSSIAIGLVSAAYFGGFIAGSLTRYLAEQGYTGPEHVLDGKEGFSHVFDSQWKFDILTDGLGDSWRILQCGMKFFPTEALTHAPISATLDLVTENDLAPDRVKEVRIQTLARAADILALIDQVRRTVQEKRGVLLEPEVKIVGEDD